MKISKAVVMAAGLGTRFLPQTKAMPKEMLPIIDKPVIQYVVEEIVAAGIQDIVIITGANKRAIEDHFDSPNQELVKTLTASGKTELLDEVQAIADLANFIYIRQKGPIGSSTAVRCAEPVVGNEHFIVLNGDEFFVAEPARINQLIEVHDQLGGGVLPVLHYEDKQVLSRFGVVDVEQVSEAVYKIKGLIEKPKPEEAPSNFAAMGGYLLPPDIFDILRVQKPGKNGEMFLPEAIHTLIQSGFPMYACVLQNARYYDTGTKVDYLKTILDLALRDPQLKEKLKAHLDTLHS